MVTRAFSSFLRVIVLSLIPCPPSFFDASTSSSVTLSGSLVIFIREGLGNGSAIVALFEPFGPASLREWRTG